MLAVGGELLAARRKITWLTSLGADGLLSYVYIYIYIYIYIYMCLYISLSVCMSVYLFIYIYIYVYVLHCLQGGCIDLGQ